jgi:hypothetical protein
MGIIIEISEDYGQLKEPGKDLAKERGYMSPNQSNRVKKDKQKGHP